jgi:hypothetical protein
VEDHCAPHQLPSTQAPTLPYGGVSLVAQATGLSRTTIYAGMRELEKGRRKVLPAKRSRRPGGGRKSLTFHNPDLLQALEKLVEPTTRGDPESPLRRPPRQSYPLDCGRRWNWRKPDGLHLAV